ncbi:hypothetical protein JB92DRAFT_1750208 [Gautieria morchelliformis]|nr:hypothetical protein JB92DRAFT_1750208 [Gautieria morchelliformis]
MCSRVCTPGMSGGFFCDGCYSEIYGKRFHCIDCEDFDLCNDCEHADPPRHPSTDHSTSHTMILFKFNTSNRLARGMFDHRAKKHMAKHERSGCGCSRLEGTSAFIENEIVECACCKEAILNKGHFRCLQCSEVDICEDCERSGSPEHCPSHAMIKVMIPPGNEGVLSDVEDTDDEGPPLNVEEKLDRMRKYIRDMKISHKNRLDQMQADFTSKLDQVITLLEQKQPPNPASFNEHRYCILRSPDA